MRTRGRLLAVKGAMLLCAMAAGAWALHVELQLGTLRRELAWVRQARVGMHEQDVRRHWGAPAAVVTGAAELTLSPYRDYEQSARAFSDHVVIYFVGGEMVQLHCDRSGRVECVFWGRRTR